MNVPEYNIVSFEINDINFIEYRASRAKPMIISNGIARMSDIQKVLDVCKRIIMKM